MMTTDDTGYHLRVMATYTDAAGTDMAMEYSIADHDGDRRGRDDG